MDSTALRGMLEASHGESFAWALHCCGRDQADAEEVLQTVYLKVLDRRARFDGRSSFMTWLFGVIRRTAAEERRRNRWRGARLLPFDPEVGVEGTGPRPDQAVQRAERRAMLLAGLARLSARQREVLLLVFYHGRTIEEAAAVIGVSLGAARRHYERGKARLRALLPRMEVVGGE